VNRELHEPHGSGGFAKDDGFGFLREPWIVFGGEGTAGGVEFGDDFGLWGSVGFVPTYRR